MTPARGRGQDGVARNQRERIFAAMVASVSRHGYRATRVADVVELAGVSSRSFYELFDDKPACFAAAIKAILGEGAARLSTAVATAHGREEVVGEALHSLAALVAAQPAAARAALVEADVAGPAATVPLEAALHRLEAIGRERLAEDPELVGLPAELFTSQIGAVREIARTLLREDREGELAQLAGDLTKVICSYRPPPEPLRVSARKPAFAPETIDPHDHGERALRALTALVAEQGYGKTTVEQILGRAAMSPTTFYANFRDKEDALMAAIDSAGAQVVAAVLPTFRRSSDWPRAVRAAFGSFFNFLASRPALARMLIVEVYAAGPAAVKRRDEALRPLQAIVAEGRLRAPEVPAIAGEAISGAATSLARAAIRRSGPVALPGLAPLCTYLALAPFIGAQAACEAANGDGQPRRAPISARVSRVIASEIGQAIEGGSFDARPDRHLTHAPVVLDERGWRELRAAHRKAYEAALRIGRESEERLKTTGGERIEAHAVQALFGFPKP